MKRINILIILCFYSIVGCVEYRKDNNASDILSLPEYNSIKDTVYKILDDYRRYLNTPREIVFQVFIDQNPDSTTIYLTFIQYKTQLEKFNPTGYIKIGEDLFLLYSGLNLLFSADSTFLKKLNDEISLIDLKEEDEIPILFRNYPWTITYLKQNKQYILNRKALCPYTE